MADLLSSIDNERYRDLCGKLLVTHVGGPAAMEIVVMHFESGYSVRRVADITRRAPSTVSRIIRRARCRLSDLGILPASWRRKRHNPRKRGAGKHGRKPAPRGA